MKVFSFFRRNMTEAKEPGGSLRQPLVVMLVSRTVLFGIILAFIVVSGMSCQGKESRETYSAFGVSFKYPSGMKILEIEASERSGLVYGVLTEKEEEEELEQFAVEWQPIPASGAIYMKGLLEDNVSNALIEVYALVDPANVNIGEIQATTANGRDVLWQPYDYPLYGKPAYNVDGGWYCNKQRRLYFLHVITSESDAFGVFKKYLDSFSCN